MPVRFMCIERKIINILENPVLKQAEHAPSRPVKNLRPVSRRVLIHRTVRKPLRHLKDLFLVSYSTRYSNMSASHKRISPAQFFHSCCRYRREHPQQIDRPVRSPFCHCTPRREALSNRLPEPTSRPSHFINEARPDHSL